MILVDSLYINNGGGLVLLKYLVQKLEEAKLNVFYIFDSRAASHFSYIEEHRKIELSNSIFNRYKFYYAFKNKFSSILCFGNIPPPIKSKAMVYVYFHQKLFIEIPDNFTIKNKIIFYVKQKIFSLYRKNTDFWITQSDLMRDILAEKYFSSIKSTILVVPFYPPVLKSEEISVLKRNKSSFLYVSNSSPHKNHEKLIEAFCTAYDQTGKGTLTLTIPASSVALCELIFKKKDMGYPIENVGFIERDDLFYLYCSHEFLIFPSLSESFGLGLVEAIDCGCKVLVSDLPYAFQVCQPSLTFNPHSADDIKKAILIAMNNTLQSSRNNIHNNINELISLLRD